MTPHQVDRRESQGLLQGGARIVRLTQEKLERAKGLLGASMRFFTPQLYLRFNSPDDEEAARA